MQKRILLVAEAVTFAHVARIETLRGWLTQLGYLTTVAHDGRYDQLLPPDAKHLPLYTVPTSRFLDHVNRVQFPYSAADLNKYIEEDTRVISEVQPNLVIGDFRLSLAVSCRKLGVPYVSLTNGYWTPMSGESLAVPPLRFFQRLPHGLAYGLFGLGRAVGFRLAARPFNTVARQHGCSEKSGSLLEVYTQADHVLVVEPPGWLRMNPSSGKFFTEIGPVSWSSSQPLPAWWPSITPGDRLIYVSLGSSGDARLIDRIVASLAHERVTIVVSGRPAEERLVGNSRVFFGPFFNATEILKRAQVFVSNGGSLSMVDALSCGCPVVGIPSNYDQILNMRIAEERGVGAVVKTPVTPSRIREVVLKFLERSPEVERALTRARELFSSNPDLRALGEVVERMASRSAG